MSEEESLINFPCDFPIKIIGQNTDTFNKDIIEIVKKNYPDTLDENIKTKVSKDNKYVSISITVHAHDKASLDELYMQLTSHPEIRMVL